MSDDQLLDDVFDRAVELISRGQAPQSADLLPERPDLEPEVSELLILAREVVRPPPDAVPVVPGYELLRKLGAGGMGTVWLAKQQAVAGRLVALKCLPAGALASVEAGERFVAETRALARVKHHHVVTIHEVIAHSGVRAYAMEWVDGRSLAQVLGYLQQLGRRPQARDLAAALESPTAVGFTTYPRVVAQLGAAIARALSSVHAAGFVHRDVKPSNVLLDRSGVPRLSDFGIVHDADSAMATRTGAFVGTLAYAAPEQLRGEPDRIDQRADVYGLGATLYDALALRPPYAGVSAPTLLRAMQTRAPRSLRSIDPAIPRDLDTVIGKALAPESASRYATAAEFAEDLERVLESRPIRARPVGMFGRAWRLARRQRRLLAAGMAGGLLVFAVSALWAWYWLWLPGHVASCVQEARLSMLNSSFTELLFLDRDPSRTGDRLRESFLERNPDVLTSYRTALNRYDDAMFWRNDREVAAERAAVRYAIAFWDGGNPPPPSAPGDATLCDYLASPRVPVDPGALDLQTRRSLGLLAYLCADPRTTEACWAPLHPVPGEDPLIDLAMGMLLLNTHRPEHAVALLTAAFERLPEAGFVGTQLADAWLRLGAADRAAPILERARRLPHPAVFGLADVLAADLLAWHGDTTAALERYLDVIGRHRSERAHLHASRLLTLLGRAEDGMSLLVQLRWYYPGESSYVRMLGDAARAWWTSLNAADRVARIAQACCEPGSSRRGLAAWLSVASLPPLDEAALQSARERGLWVVPTTFENRWQLMNGEHSSSSPLSRGVSLRDLVVTKELLAMNPPIFAYLPPLARHTLAALTLGLDQVIAAAGLTNRLRDSRWLRGVVRLTGRGLAPLAALGVLGIDAGAQSVIQSWPGAAAGGRSGACATPVGDWNGDGYVDIAVGESASGSPTLPGTVVVRSGCDGQVLAVFSGGAAGDEFGLAVAALDVNRDGTLDLLVGAGQYGAAVGYVQAISGRAPHPVLYTLTGRAANDRYGYRLAVLDDLNGDGIPELGIGASQWIDFNHPGNGRGYVDIVSSTTGALVKSLIGPTLGSRYGIAIESVGDIYRGDGIEEFIVGADLAGAATVYDGATYTPINVHLGTGSFGIAIAGFTTVPGGDLDGDRVLDYVIVQRDYGTVLPGAVYAYSGRTHTLLWKYVGLPGSQPHALAAIEDIDGDGIADVLVGADHAASGKVGEVVVLSGQGLRTLSSQELRRIRSDERGLPGDRFGWSVERVGDIDRDGIVDYVVGSIHASPGGARSGFVRLISSRPLALDADPDFVSATNGGTQMLTLNLGTPYGGHHYLMLGTFTGTRPGFNFQGVHFPLNIDSYTSLAGGWIVNGAGQLDAVGQSMPMSLTLGPLPPNAVGLTLHHTAAIFDPSFARVVTATNAVPLTVVN